MAIVFRKIREVFDRVEFMLVRIGFRTTGRTGTVVDRLLKHIMQLGSKEVRHETNLMLLQGGDGGTDFRVYSTFNSRVWVIHALACILSY